MTGFFQKLFYTTGCAFELARGVILFGVALTLVNIFIITTNVVNGASMEPNFHTGQYVAINKLSYLVREPRRGEAVILKFPGDPEKTRYIKRVVGLPGETIKISGSRIYIDDLQVSEPYIPKEFLTQPDLEKKLGEDEYFVMGDNRENSNDSRVFGPVERRFIIGLAYFIIYPLTDAGLVPPEFYIRAGGRISPTPSPSPQ